MGVLYNNFIDNNSHLFLIDIKSSEFETMPSIIVTIISNETTNQCKKNLIYENDS